MEELFNPLMSAFDLQMVVSTILATYIIIKLIGLIKPVTRLWKQIITALVGVAIAIVFHFHVGTGIAVLIPSYLLSIIAYDKAIKVILKKLRLSYK